jgi:hypothetical protein
VRLVADTSSSSLVSQRRYHRSSQAKIPLRGFIQTGDYS